MKKFIFSIFLLFLINFSNFAQEKFNDTLFVTGINRENLGKYVTFWVDSSKTANIKKIENTFLSHKFKHWNSNSTLNLGKNPYPLWFHLTVKNNSKKYQDYWWSFYTQADTITVYKKLNQQFKSIDTILNSTTLLDDKKVRTRFPAIKIELDAFEAQEYFVKIENLRNTQNAITDLTTPEDNLMWEKKFYWSTAFFIGCFSLISILCFFLGLFVKEKAFLFYSLYLLFIIAMILSEELMIGVVKDKTIFYILNHLHSLPNAIIALSLHFKLIKFILYQKNKQPKVKILSILNFSFLIFGFVFNLIYFIWKEEMFFDAGIFPYLWNSSIFVVFSLMTITFISIILRYKKKKYIILSSLLGLLLLYYNPAGYFLNYAGILNYYPITYPNYFYWIVFIEFILLGCFIGWRHQQTLKRNYQLLSNKSKKKEKDFRKKIAIQKKERATIAQDLHDDLGATLSAVKLIVTNSYQQDKTLLNMVTKANTDLRIFFNKLTDNSQKEINIIKEIQEKIYSLNSIGKLNITFISLGTDQKIATKLKQPIYKICNELLNNILKHSQAKEATLQIIIDDLQIEILAEDNGIGYNTKLANKGMGINNIKERVKKWKGNYYVSSNKNGTTSIITLPNKL